MKKIIITFLILILMTNICVAQCLTNQLSVRNEINYFIPKVLRELTLLEMGVHLLAQASLIAHR